MNNNRNYRRLLTVLCLLLVLVYASALFLPHCHECGNESCVACNLIKSIGCIGAVLGLYFSLALLDNSAHYYFDAFREAMILHNSAPVWLKVKLSS